MMSMRNWNRATEKYLSRKQRRHGGDSYYRVLHLKCHVEEFYFAYTFASWRFKALIMHENVKCVFLIESRECSQTNM